MTAPAPGTVLLDKYRVDHVLGQGGMGVVVAATHLHLGERVAIKLLLPEVVGNPDVVARFVREARAAVRLKGEHVARIVDVGTLPWGAPYIVMEYLDGIDLAGVIEQRGSLPPGEAIDYLLQACEAMAEAHSLGIVHRDIKPANFFVAHRPDGSPLLKVLDFGISKAPVGDNAVNLTRTQAVMGTPGYMSPEQLRGVRDVDARTDIWSLGVVLYEALGGRRPFDADTFSGLAIKVATDPTPNLAVALPPGLDVVIYRCLEKDQSRRFQSVAELAYALAPYAGNRRQAETIVERTAGILRVSMPAGPRAATGPTMIAPPPYPTTLGGSAGMLEARPRSRRGAIIASAFVVAAAGIAIIVVATRGGSSAASVAEPAAKPTPVEPPAPPAPAPVVEAPKQVVEAPKPAPVVEAPAPPPAPAPVVEATPKPEPVAQPAKPKPAAKKPQKPADPRSPAAPVRDPLDNRM